MQLRPILVNLAVSLTSLIIFCGVLEGGARLVWTSERTGNCRELDKVLVYRNKPSCEFRHKKPEGDAVLYQINACGFRGSEDCAPRRDDVYRIFGIGDSFTFGDMVPNADTYLKVAERLWNNALPYEIEVLNGGVQGYDLHQYSLRLADAFDRDVQLVIVGLLPNDLFSDLSPEKISERADLVKQFGVQKTHELLYERSQRSLFHLFKTILSYSRFVELLTHVVLSNEAIYLKTYLLRSSQEDSFLKSKYSPVWQKKIQHAEHIIQKMARRAHDHHVELAIILIPQRIQALLVKNDYGDETIDPFAFSRKLELIGKRYGIQVFDFLQRLKEHEDPVALYYPVDGHLTPAGQKLLGEFVTERFMRAGLLPETYPQQDEFLASQR